MSSLVQRSLWIVALMAIAGAGSGGATTYYVAPPPTGDDSNPGTELQPWATLQKAADTVQAGDTVLVRAGQYAGGHFTTSGSPGLPIVLASYPGEEVEITDDNPVTPDGINLEGASWMVIEGFGIDGRTRAGIRAVLCEQVVVRDNRLDANGRWGVFTGFCDDLLIENNETSNSIVEHGIYVSNSGDRPVIRGNRAWGNNANGIHMNGDVSQGGDGVISEALVEANLIFGNGVAGGSGINMDGVQDSLIRNNLIFDTHASGISLYQIDGGAPSTGNRVLNNTVIVAADGRWGLNIRDGAVGNTVINNTFYSFHGYRGAVAVTTDSLSGLVSDHNAVEDRFTTDGGNSVMTLAEWQTATGQDADSVIATPEQLFVDPDNDDYHLAAGSPGVDAGMALAAVITDLEGTPRPIGATHDIGAFEGVGIIFADGFESGDSGRWSAVAEESGTSSPVPRSCHSQVGAISGIVAESIPVERRKERSRMSEEDKSLWDSAKDMVEDSVDKAKDAAEDVVEKAKEMGEDAWEKAEDIGEAVTRKVGEAAGSAMDAAEAAKDVAAAKAGDAWKATTEVAGSITDKVVEAKDKVMGSTAEGSEEITEDLTEAARKAVDDIESTET